MLFHRSCRLALVFLVLWAEQAIGIDAPGYGDYTHWADWARVRVGVQAGLASSFDRTGGNSDFSQYDSPEGLLHEEVVASVRIIEGPGVIYRFWMPHLTANRSFVVRMFFDNEEAPRIDTTSDALFAGIFAHFAPPLVDTGAGGQVCYEPIPFAGALRIETVNKVLPVGTWSPDRHYYQYSYMLYPPGTELDSYTGTLSPEHQTLRAEMVNMFNAVGQHPAGESQTAVQVTTAGGLIAAGEALALAALEGPGTIRRLQIGMGSATDDELRGLHLVVTYDDQATPAIDVPVGEFFGAGNLRVPYKSLPMGTDSPDGFYCYWPVPFRESVLVELVNTTSASISIDSGMVEYEASPVATAMGYLHARVNSDSRAPGQVYHQILSATGRGHYVGSLLYIEQDAWSFSMLEGDDVIVVDGVNVICGTGLEDTYNGGYYYNWVGVQPNEPEGSMPQSVIRPLHGILYVHREAGIEHARSDQYRWRIADRIPFSNGIDVKIENQYAVVGALWTSVAFWYEQPPVPGDADNDGDLDLADFAALQRCFFSQTLPCLETFGVDGSAIDLDYFATFQSLLNGPW